MKSLCSMAALLAALCVPLEASAWGAEGHRVIAELAEAQLTAEARVEINRLLALEPGARLASVSTWAAFCPAYATGQFLGWVRVGAGLRITVAGTGRDRVSL